MPEINQITTETFGITISNPDEPIVISLGTPGAQGIKGDKGDPGEITADSVNDAAIGSRTADQETTAVFSNTGLLTQFLSWFAKQLRAITGKSNWYDTPAITLESAATQIASNAAALDTKANSGINTDISSLASGIQIGNGASGTKSIIFNNGSSGSLQANPTVARTWTLPDVSGNLYISGQPLGIGQTATVAKIEINTENTSTKGLLVKAGAQVNGFPLLEFQNPSGQLIAQLDAFGRFYLNPGQSTRAVPTVTDGAFVVAPRVAGAKTLVVIALPSQTGNLAEFQSSDGANLLSVNSSGFITLGSGTTLRRLVSVSATINYPSISPGSSSDTAITVTGATVGDSVALGLPSSPAAGIVFNAFVSAANTVIVRATNATGAAIDPASASYRVTVIGF